MAADRERIPVVPRARHHWTHLLITDVDNTLFDFGLYAEAGLREVLPTGSRLLGLPVDSVADEVRAAFRHFNSIEIPFAFEAMPCLADRSAEERLAISKQFVHAFWRGASQAMTPYPGVSSTLQHLQRNGTAIVAVSDAPMREVWRKLRRLGLIQFFAGVVGVGTVVRRRDPLLRDSDIPGYERPSHSPHRFYRGLRDDERKPSRQAYEAVLREVAVPRELVTVVGDSPTKDLAPARELGLAAYWAAYGERNRHLETTLQSVTPFEPPEAVECQAEAASSYPALSSFDDLEDIIPVPQPRLPRMSRSG